MSPPTARRTRCRSAPRAATKRSIRPPTTQCTGGASSRRARASSLSPPGCWCRSNFPWRDEPMDSHAYGMAAFLAQSDAVGKSALLVLFLMSVATWYLIISKAIHAAVVGRSGARFLERFWGAPDLESAAAQLDAGAHPDPFSALA